MFQAFLSTQSDAVLRQVIDDTRVLLQKRTMLLNDMGGRQEAAMEYRPCRFDQMTTYLLSYVFVGGNRTRGSNLTGTKARLWGHLHELLAVAACEHFLRRPSGCMADAPPLPAITGFEDHQESDLSQLLSTLSASTDQEIAALLPGNITLAELPFLSLQSISGGDASQDMLDFVNSENKIIATMTDDENAQTLLNLLARSVNLRAEMLMRSLDPNSKKLAKAAFISYSNEKLSEPVRKCMHVNSCTFSSAKAMVKFRDSTKSSDNRVIETARAVIQSWDSQYPHFDIERACRNAESEAAAKSFLCRYVGQPIGLFIQHLFSPMTGQE